MKKTTLFTFTVFILFTLCSQNIFAQDSSQWHLPEGAKARLGKGEINEIAYSPDGTRLAVASSIGVWLYDTATHQVGNSRNGEIALLTGHTGGVSSVAFQSRWEYTRKWELRQDGAAVERRHGAAQNHSHGAYGLGL